jgi:hypothetical protein
MGCFKGRDSRNWGRRPIRDSTNPIQDLDSSSSPVPANKSKSNAEKCTRVRFDLETSVALKLVMISSQYHAQVTQYTIYYYRMSWAHRLYCSTGSEGIARKSPRIRTSDSSSTLCPG